MRLIGVGGHMGAGKSTVARILCGDFGFHELTFAAPLKRAAMAAFGLTEAQVYDQDAKEVADPFWKMTGRQILQKMGTESMRGTFGEDVWVRALFRRLADIRPGHVSPACHFGCDLKHPGVVVSDVRFANEAEAIRREGGALWLVQRPGCEDHTGHASELLARQPTKWDRVLANDGDLDDLSDRVHTILTGGAR